MNTSIYDLSHITPPPIAYFSISETPLKSNPKAYTHGFTYEMIEWKELHKVTAKYSYSTMSFLNGHRLKANVTGYGNIFIFDIDNDSAKNKNSYKAREVIKLVKGIKSLVVSTRSHTEQEHRLRLILLADKNCNVNLTAELYREVMLTIIDFCGLDPEMLDKSCFSTDRQYAPNPNNQTHFYIDGELLPMDFIMSEAIHRLKTKELPLQAKPLQMPINARSGDLKVKRAFIKANHAPRYMFDLLRDRGLTVKDNGAVIIQGNKTDALSVDMKTGLLRDFANETSYDVVSVLHDHYKMPLADATNYMYEKMGGR